MAREYSIEGWRDFFDDRHEGEPTNIHDTYSVLVHVTDTRDPDFNEWFWSHVGGPFTEWDEWYDYIEGQIEMYGYAE